MPDIESHSELPARRDRWDEVAERLRRGEIVSVPVDSKYTRHSAVLCLRNRGVSVTTRVRDGRLYLAIK